MYQIYFGMTLHVSDGLSVHHQDLKTVHTAIGICQTDNCCLLASGYEMEMANQFHLASCSKQTAVSVWQMRVAVCTVFNSWWWTERPSETCRVSFQNKFDALVHLVGFTIEIYHDARPYECHIYQYVGMTRVVDTPGVFQHDNYHIFPYTCNTTAFVTSLGY